MALDKLSDTSYISYMKINYDELDEQYDQLPNRGKMSTSRDPEINTRMATLKRTEGAINRYRNLGLIK
jgi:hypothetical protein